jgi:hypothetical protein
VRRGAAILAAACAIVLAGSGSASASVTIGQLAPTPPAPTCPSSGAGYDYLQTSVTGGNLYSARAAGTITSWSTNSASPDATFVFKVFRRTSDPDFFQVVGRAVEHTLTAGVNTVSTDLHVESGDLIGLHEEGGGPTSSCTFPTPGDGALRSPGDVADGQPAQFSPVTDVRLNLSAVLVPSNAFTITSITRHKNGTATLTADLSNPGLLTIGGAGLRKKHVSAAVASRVTLNVATTGKRMRTLARKGALKVPVGVTFYPTGGDPNSQTIPVKLRQRRELPPV